jgi:hypothetical protein
MIAAQQERRRSYNDSLDDQAEGDTLAMMHLACALMDAFGIANLAEIWRPGVPEARVLAAKDTIAELLSRKTSMLPALGRVSLGALWGKHDFAQRIVSSSKKKVPAEVSKQLGLTKSALLELLRAAWRVFGLDPAWRAKGQERMLVARGRAQWRFVSDSASPSDISANSAPFEEWPVISDISGTLRAGSLHWMSFNSGAQGW